MATLLLFGLLGADAFLCRLDPQRVFHRGSEDHLRTVEVRFSMTTPLLGATNYEDGGAGGDADAAPGIAEGLQAAGYLDSFGQRTMRQGAFVTNQLGWVKREGFRKKDEDEDEEDGEGDEDSETMEMDASLLRKRQDYTRRIQAVRSPRALRGVLETIKNDPTVNADV